MKTFTIENETNNIVAHATKREAAAVPNADSFASDIELSELAANWPAPRLIEIWNSIPGNTPVRKFTDRKTAATRIWKAIQSLRDTASNDADLEAGVLKSEAAEQPLPPQTTLEIAPDPTHAPTAENVEVEVDSAPSGLDADVSEQTPDIAPGLAKGD